MSFRLVSKSVTLNDLERRIMALILRYFTELAVRYRRKAIIRLRPTSVLISILLIVDHSNTICAII